MIAHGALSIAQRKRQQQLPALRRLRSQKYPSNWMHYSWYCWRGLHIFGATKANAAAFSKMLCEKCCRCHEPHQHAR